MQFEEDTKTHKKFGAALDEILDRADLQADAWPLDYSKELLQSVARLVDCPDMKDLVNEGIESSLDSLKEIADSAPDFAAGIQRAVETLALMMMAAANEIACQSIGVEHAKLLNLPQYKQKISGVETRAGAIAEEFCENDTERDLRFGDLSKIVSYQLVREGFDRCGPKAVKGWIDFVRYKHPYLSKPGRKKKV